jgi:hypothetical protein
VISDEFDFIQSLLLRRVQKWGFPSLGTVYTYDFGYESVYDLLSNEFGIFFRLKCVNRWMSMNNRIPIRALSAASADKFNIAPVRWQHPSHVAIVPTESKGKTEGNDWDTACGNF